MYFFRTTWWKAQYLLTFPTANTLIKMSTLLGDEPEKPQSSYSNSLSRLKGFFRLILFWYAWDRWSLIILIINDLIVYLSF